MSKISDSLRMPLSVPLSTVDRIHATRRGDLQVRSPGDLWEVCQLPPRKRMFTDPCSPIGNTSADGIFPESFIRQHPDATYCALFTAPIFPAQVSQSVPPAPVASQDPTLPALKDVLAEVVIALFTLVGSGSISPTFVCAVMPFS